MKRSLSLFPAVLLLGALVFGLSVADHHEKPIKALLVTGEGYHDYENQKRIISEGVSERLKIEWTILHHKKAEEAKIDLSKDGWADPYDVVVYNICHAKEKDGAFVEKLVAMHAEGKPAVALHCTMHSYHWEIKAEEGVEKPWVKLLGVYSRNHGPHLPIKVTKAEGADHEIMKGFPDEGWTTPKGELYNVGRVLDTATVLAYGNHDKVKEPQACIWVNQYGKARVFGTTLGHHNETMESKEYLDLLSRGIKWAAGAKVPAAAAAKK